MTSSASTQNLCSDRQQLKRLAGERYFERGEDYYNRNMVLDFIEYQGAVHAKVQGSYQDAYRVRLWFENAVLDYSCTCPLGEDGEFCKHCVAVGLFWINLEKGARQKSTVTLEDVKAYLKALDSDVLVDMLMQQVLEDEQLRERLFIKAAKTSEHKGLDLKRLKRLLENAIVVDGFIDYSLMHHYEAGVDAAYESLEELLKEGYSTETIELTEYALSLIEEAIESVDDSDGYTSMIIQQLEELHHEACKQAKPDIEALVKRIFERQLRTDWDIFLNIPETYADVFGHKGMEIYKQLVEAEWEKVPALQPSEKGKDDYKYRSQITHIMETLARQTGDIEKQVSIMERDLSEPYGFLKIATIYRQAGQYDKAIHWAEKGRHAFPNKPDWRLREFLAETYQEQGSTNKAIDLRWQIFTEAPGLRTYKPLKESASQPHTLDAPWPALRIKALAFMRESIAKTHEQNKNSYSSYTPQNRLPNKTPLVEILLWEEDIETAWQESRQGWCQDSLLLTLAQKREDNHPADVLKIYQDQIEPRLALKNNEAYQQAVSYLLKIKSLMERLGKPHKAFDDYLTDVRRTHKAKRNFVKLLEQTKGL